MGEFLLLKTLGASVEGLKEEVKGLNELKEEITELKEEVKGLNESREEVKSLNELTEDVRNGLKRQAQEQSERMVETNGRLDAMKAAADKRDEKVESLSAMVSRAVPWSDHHKVQKELHKEKKLCVCELRQDIRHLIEMLILRLAGFETILTNKSNDATRKELNEARKQCSRLEKRFDDMERLHHQDREERVQRQKWLEDEIRLV